MTNERLRLRHRVPLNFMGKGAVARAYGGRLDAWSFSKISGPEWFARIQQEVAGAMCQRFLPIYRMGDGEFRFLMGRKYNFHRRPLWREIGAVTAEKIGLTNRDNWKTSWGENYTAFSGDRLREHLKGLLRHTADLGYIACYINDNALHAFTEYNTAIATYFASSGIRFDARNYIPFHFAVGLLTEPGWEQFIVDRRVLIVSSINEEQRVRTRDNILGLGAREVSFVAISQTSALVDQIDLSAVPSAPDIALVAAGIGAVNVLGQLEPLRTVCLDIGGFINCLANRAERVHGGSFGFPHAF